MRRFSPVVALLALAVLILATAERSGAQGQDRWCTIQGRIVWGGTKLPEPKWIDVKADKAHCLTHPTAKEGKILDDVLVVNAKNKGVKNVFVYIYVEGDEKIPIHPDLQAIPKPAVIDQPCCLFEPRIVVLRQGQDLVVKNSAPVKHSIKWGGDPGGSAVIAEGGSHTIKNLKADRLPLSLDCAFHGWMQGRALVCNHPYATITDADGNFEIKLAPVGKHKIMIYHEEIGYRTGPPGKFGEEKMLKPGVNDLGDLSMGKDKPKDDD
jgi:hypothetical protein